MQTPARLTHIAKTIEDAPIDHAPAPWRFVAVVPVGGLWAVGSDELSEELLIISSSGQGLVDGTTGKLLSRNVLQDGYDAVHLQAKVMGTDERRTFRMSGLHGGGLQRVTEDLWKVYEEVVCWPYRSLLLFPPHSDLYGSLYNKRHDFTKLAIETEMRAFGFSWSGKTLVIATSSEVKIYNRADF